MASKSYTLFSRVSFHGRVVEERYARTGVPVRLALGGADAEAQVVWLGPASCEVRVGGAPHLVEPGRDLTVSLGDIELTLYLAEQVPLRRVGSVALGGALSWLTVVSMLCAGGVQLGWLWSRSCDLAAVYLLPLSDVGGPLLWAVAPLGGLVAALFVLVLGDDPRRSLRWLALPVVALVIPAAYEVSGARYKDGATFVADEMEQCRPPAAAGDIGGYTAEYLARLLRKDYDGENDQIGIVDEVVERPETDKVSDQRFIPAGSAGPSTRLGGAERVALRPVRVVAEDDTFAAERAQAPAPPVDAAGRPIAGADPADPKAGAAEGAGDAARERRAQAPADRRRGVGLSDWYDERDAAADRSEVRENLQIARQRLKIDPDDMPALSLLSRYQYLAQDYKSALASWDRYIELYPEDPGGYNNKALVYKRLKKYGEEEALYRQALALEPNDVHALNNLAVNLAHQRRFDEALQIMRDLEILNPGDPYADLHRAKVHAEMGADDEALRYLELSLEGMSRLETLHHIEFRQDIRVDPSFAKLRETSRFRSLLSRYYGKDSPLEE